MIIKILNRIIKILYLNEEILLYKWSEKIEVNSIVKLKYVNQEIINDVLDFQPVKYIDIFKKFLQEKQVGIYGYIDGRCVHRTWLIDKVGTKYSLAPGLSKLIKKNEIFIHYCETAPNVRGKSVYPYVLSSIVEKNPNKNIFISTSIDNIASQKGIQKAGFKVVSTYKYKRIFGIKFVKEISHV